LDVKLPDMFHNRIVQAGLALLALAALLTLAWRYTPLREIVTVEAVMEWVDSFRGKAWGPFVLAAAYTPASLLMFPRPLLTLAAVLAFGPLKGFAVAMGGILANAWIVYQLGRVLDEKRLKRLGGPKFGRVAKMLRREGLLAVTLVGLVPVAPFFAEMLAFGAMRLKLRHVLPGVALANLPGTLGTTLLGDQLAAVLDHERTLNPWIVVAVVAAMAAIAYFSHRQWRRMEAAA
jgi:phospholipase D1/2